MPLNNDDIKQLINILQRGLIEDSEPEEKQSQVIHSKPNKKSVSRQRKNKKVANESNNSYNRFDDMPEKNMHKDDTKIDQVLSQYSPTQRSREFNFIDVVCRVCGRKDSINPALVYDSGSRYKCNKCSKIPG